MEYISVDPFPGARSYCFTKICSNRDLGRNSDAVGEKLVSMDIWYCIRVAGLDTDPKPVLMQIDETRTRVCAKRLPLDLPDDRNQSIPMP